MAVGFPTKVDYATGDVLSAGNMNDLSGTVNLLESAQYAAGKNKIINGDFGVWQRGTSFSSPANAVYTSDRWQISYNGTGATQTISQQTFTPGTAPVAGYEGQFFWRWEVTVNGISNTFRGIQQKIEDVRTLAGQTMTVSFWAKADSARTLGAVQISQDFGVGGSSTVFTSITPSTTSLTTSWQRITGTVTVPSVSGKTIGTSSALIVYIGSPSNVLSTFDIWGIQVEAGSTASPFQTATGTIQGELAACQRYYYRATTAAIPARLGWGFANSTVVADITVTYPVQMRRAPTALEQSGTAGDYSVIGSGTTITVCSAVPIFNNATTTQSQTSFTVASGLTAGQFYLGRQVNTNAYLGWSAEL